MCVLLYQAHFRQRVRRPFNVFLQMDNIPPKFGSRLMVYTVQQLTVDIFRNWYTSGVSLYSVIVMKSYFFTFSNILKFIYNNELGHCETQQKKNASRCNFLDLVYWMQRKQFGGISNTPLWCHFADTTQVIRDIRSKMTLELGNQ